MELSDGQKNVMTRVMVISNIYISVFFIKHRKS